MSGIPIAIRCQGLSKQYRIGERESYKALRDVITDAAAAPFRRLRSAVRNGNGSSVRNPQSDIRNSDSFWALSDVSFEVGRGEVVGIIGRNGAGKSTLLKILSRITKPTAGQAEIHGRVGSLLEVGTGFHPELTGRENIYLNAAILGMRKTEVERKFDEIIAFAEVEKFVDTPVKRYSSGMYVRLAFAVAAHLEPEILIVDEVLAVGDAQFQKKCLGKIGEVAQGGRTVLFVSHNMGAIRNLCASAIWLEEGRIVGQGNAVQIVDQYLHSITRSSGSSIELSQAKRYPGFGERMRLRSIEFNQGKPVLHGEALTIKIEFETTSEIHGAAVGFGFSSFEGTRLMSTDTDLLHLQKDLPKNFVGSVEGTIAQLQLQPGRYGLDVGARSGNISLLDYVGACAQIEVLPGPRTPALSMRKGRGLGIPADWRWSEPASVNGNHGNPVVAREGELVAGASE
jgi:lipopolysaccharide transport system ATP-binding protein